MPDAGRLAALEAWSSHADRSIEGLDRKMERGFRDIADALARIQRDVNEGRRFPTGTVLTAVIGFAAILLTIIGLWLDGYSGEQNRHESAIASMASAISKHVQEPGHDVAMMLHGQTAKRLDEMETQHLRELERIGGRLDVIEMSRFSSADGDKLRDSQALLREQVAVLRALVPAAPATP